MELKIDGEFCLNHCDTIEHLEAMPPACIDLSIFSPPFPSLYAYTSEASDIGNSEDLRHEAKLHLSFFYKQLARIVKPGRVIMVHVAQIPRMKRNGEFGLYDFRGLNIRIGERAGLIFEYDWCITKNPQAQAIRTKSRELQFVGLERDRAKARGCLPDYMIKFRASGENAVPITDLDGQSRDAWRQKWIERAEAAWTDIKETDTLNTKEAKGENDTKHICLARGSLVLTKERGHVPIQDLELGEHVLTHMGRWRPIIAKQMTSPCATVVSVCAQGVHALTTTPTHKVWARQSVRGEGRKKAAQRKAPGWVESQNLSSCFINTKLPPEEWNDTSCNDWWIVGRWIADGHFSARGNAHVSIGNSKQDVSLEALGDKAGFMQDHGSCTQVLIKDRKNELRSILRECGSGAKNKKLPPVAFTLPQDKARALLDGYLSGDGHYDAERDRWTATTVSRELAVGLQFLIQRAYGSIATIHKGKPDRQDVIQGRTVNASQEWVVTFNASGYTFGFTADDGAWKPVKSVTPAGTAETWNIRVKEDESYTAEGCVVKNCPLQLDLIGRYIDLYSQPNEIVFSPFTGIGSEGYMALKMGRRFYGTELKQEYFDKALKNLKGAIAERRRAVNLPLFSELEMTQPQGVA